MLSLEITNCVKVSHSPDRPNIFYEVQPRSDIDTDFSDLLSTLREMLNKTLRVVVYCRTLNMCSDLFAHFHYELGASSYYPPGSPELSENRLFGMYHGSTPPHNKEVITQSLLDPCGVVRVVFATLALGMGVDLQGVNTIIHTAKNNLLYEMRKCVFIDITNIFVNMTDFSCHFNQKDTLRIPNECLCVILTYYFLLCIMKHLVALRTIFKKVAGVDEVVVLLSPLCTGSQLIVLE